MPSVEVQKEKSIPPTSLSNDWHLPVAKAKTFRVGSDRLKRNSGPEKKKKNLYILGLSSLPICL